MIRSQLAVEIRARSEKTAPVFDIAFTHADPTVAADVVRDVTGRFIDENVKDRAQQATATAEFLDVELQRLRDDVGKQEERIRQFRMEKMGALPSQLETNLRSLDRLNVELASNLEAQEAGNQRLALLRQQRANVRVGTGPTAPSTLSSVLNAARQELLQAQRVYTDEHPNVRRLREEVARLEAELKRGEKDSATPTYSSQRSGADGARRRGGGGQPRARGEAAPGGPDPPGDRAVPGPRRGDAAARAGGARAHARLREPDGDLPQPAHQEVRGVSRPQPGAGPEGRAIQGAAPGQRAEAALLARSSHPAPGGPRRVACCWSAC